MLNAESKKTIITEDIVQDIAVQARKNAKTINSTFNFNEYLFYAFN